MNGLNSQYQAIIEGTSKCFKSALTNADLFSEQNWPVLLTGETGVGKELIARRIHERSPRKWRPFVPINCAALPPTLLESELYGFEKGAFTGAVQSNRGIVRSANGGTLLLDEVGDLDLSAQVKLLRLLDSGEVRSIGGTKTEQVDLRIIAATNVNLEHAVREGKFRLDLWERLSVLMLRVPPLRERKGDLVPIASAILEMLGYRCSCEALEILKSYDWPGNVRQLKNMLIRVGVLGKGAISGETLNEALQDEKSRHEVAMPNGVKTLASREKNAIMEQLLRNRGNRKLTAKDLGIAKSTLQEKLKRWKLEDHEEQKESIGHVTPFNRRH